MSTTATIAVSDIAIPSHRMRVLRPELVAELAGSIESQGLHQAIVVRPREGGGYTLIAGRHRFEAVRRLGWPSIRASIREGLSDEQAALIEIDENLTRGDLTPAEQAAHHARRKELYLKLKPATKKGGAPGAGRGKKRRSEEAQIEPYTREAAKKTGKSNASVKRAVHRGEKIADVAELAGTSLDKGDELDAMAKLPPAEQRTLAERARTGERVSARTRLKQVARQEREEKLGKKQLALPDREYGVIAEDYEWDYEPWSRETGMDRHAANHYPVSEDAHTAQEIVERTKDRFKCAAKDCVLFMWATVPHLAIAVDVLRLRGFRYVSNFGWDKVNIATGHWNRNRHEHVLIGIKGHIPCPAAGEQWDSLFSEPARGHSVKPEHFYKLVEAYFPNLPKIELNRRGAARPGWDAWGYEVEAAGSCDAEATEPAIDDEQT